MPLLLIFIAVAAIAIAVKGTGKQAAALLAHDAPGFAVWSVSILIVGGIGFIPGLERISRAFLLLILVTIVLSKQGVITQLQNAFATPIPSDPGLTGNPMGLGPIELPQSPNLYAPQQGGGPQRGGTWFSSPQTGIIP